MKEKRKYNCVECGKQFETFRKDSRFCGMKCYIKEYNRLNADKIKEYHSNYYKRNKLSGRSYYKSKNGICEVIKSPIVSKLEKYGLNINDYNFDDGWLKGLLRKDYVGSVINDGVLYVISYDMSKEKVIELLKKEYGFIFNDIKEIYEKIRIVG